MRMHHHRPHDVGGSRAAACASWTARDVEASTHLQLVGPHRDVGSVTRRTRRMRRFAVAETSRHRAVVGRGTRRSASATPRSGRCGTSSAGPTLITPVSAREGADCPYGSDQGTGTRPRRNVVDIAHRASENAWQTADASCSGSGSCCGSHRAPTAPWDVVDAAGLRAAPSYALTASPRCARRRHEREHPSAGGFSTQDVPTAVVSHG